MKTPVVIRKEYVVYLEHAYGVNFIHCDVFLWTSSVAKRLVSDVKTLVSLSDFPIYAAHEPHDKKHLKFLRMFGFTYHSKVIHKDLGELELYLIQG